MSLNGLQICTVCDRNLRASSVKDFLGIGWRKDASTWKSYATERCDFFSSRITWTISNHDKSMTKHVHDTSGGSEKSTSQKRWLLLRTRVCCAHDFKTLNMVAFSYMWFILFYFTIVGFIFPYIMAVFRHVCGSLDIWQPNFTLCMGKKNGCFRHVYEHVCQIPN